MNGMEVAQAACRFFQDTSALLLSGTFAYLAWLVPEGLAGTIDQRLEGLRRACVALALMATAAQLPLHAADFGQGWAYAVDASALRAVLFQTGVGDAWCYQMVAAIAVVIATVLPGPTRRPATAVTAGLLLASLALTGHAVIPTGSWGIAHRIGDVLHLLCGGAWLGALPPLLISLEALRQADHRAGAIATLRRFSIAGHFAVAGVIATGVFNAWLILGAERIDPSSTYQRLLACKMVLVAVMAGLALCNRYRWVPQLKSRSANAMRMIYRATAIEIGIGVGAVALVAVFGLLSPV